MCANGSVGFARYCGKMYSRHLFPYGGLERVKGRDTRDAFPATSIGVLDLKTLSFLMFTLASCDKFYHNKSYARFPPFSRVLDA